MSDTQIPCKVWSADRKVRKSVVASTLSDLKTKGKVKLGYADEDVRVYLEDDGTLVDNDEYFQALDYDNVFLLLRASESYLQQWQTVSRDEPDSSAVKGPPTAMDKITGMLRQSVADIVTLKDEELQMIVDADTEELMSGLQRNAEETERIQDTCQRVLDEKRNMADALELANFFKNTLKRDKEEESGVVGDIKVESKAEKSREHEQMSTDKDEKDAQSHSGLESDREKESSKVGDNKVESKSSEHEQMSTDIDVTDAKSPTEQESTSQEQPAVTDDSMDEGSDASHSSIIMMIVFTHKKRAITLKMSDFEYKAACCMQKAVDHIRSLSHDRFDTTKAHSKLYVRDSLNNMFESIVPSVALPSAGDLTASSIILMVILCNYLRDDILTSLPALHHFLVIAELYPNESGELSLSELPSETKGPLAFRVSARKIFNAHLRYIYQVLKEIEVGWANRTNSWTVARDIIVMHALRISLSEDSKPNKLSEGSKPNNPQGLGKKTLASSKQDSKQLQDKSSAKSKHKLTSEQPDSSKKSKTK